MKRGSGPHGILGFSIVKTLGLLALLAAFLLGIGLLYVHSVRTGGEVSLRAQAASLAADIAARIRANPAAGAAYAGGQYSSGELVASCSRALGVCTPAQRAVADLYVWDRQVREVLPDSDNNAATPPWSITVQSRTPPFTHVITLYWLAPGAHVPSSYVLSVKN